MMMFDPPDFPYKDLAESLKEQYGSDDIFNTNTLTDLNSGEKDLIAVTEEIISSVENQLSFNTDAPGTCINLENAFFDISHHVDPNTELYVVQSDNLLNNEPMLLDENTVNQFLLPLQVSSDQNLLDSANNGPDLLALHSCVICHEIFTTEADLLDHTISAHASVSLDENQNLLPLGQNDFDEKNNGETFETEWLVCGVCERVLSTALENEPNEQLCCNDGNGKSRMMTKKLSTMFVCDFCTYLFADGESLDRHKLICYGPEEQIYCQTNQVEETNPARPFRPEYPCACGKQCSSAEDLKVHTRECQPSKGQRRPYSTHNSNKMWNCGSCNQLFVTARELYRHKRGEDRPPGAPLMAYVCEVCDKVLGSMCALHTHKKMHKVSKPGYPCRVCGRRFNQSGHLAIHMRMHTGERPYPCDLCPKAFKVKVERDDHRRTHTGERPFACAACPKTFTAAARLREHARIHTDQRPYKCEICGAAFRRPYARTVHMLIHTGEKPHDCDICGTAFRRSGDMWKHKRTLHGAQTAGDSEFKQD